ncbi:MAG: lipoprotein [Brachymonas sp.]|nr:lipoprotein [Brachymonas sp.]
MLKIRTIVKSAAWAACALGLSACGQKGDLYLPTEPEAAQRATLPRSVLPVRLRAQPAPLPSSAPSQPQPAQPTASSPRP